MSTAISTSSFLGSLGVNTHLDFGAFGYQNVSTVEAAIKYLGVSNLRDSPGTTGDLSLWQQVAQATGVKFDAYIGETSPAGMVAELATITQLGSEGILNAIEGGNEEDDSYPASLGNNIAITAQYQAQVYAVGLSLGLPTINMSFGAGWTAANNWHGDYDKVGNLAASATYSNAHTYPGVGQTADFTIQTLNADAQLAASRPVITTEIGWDASQFSQAQIANNVLDAALDGIKDGDVRMYYYSLFSDNSGNFGLMNSDGSPTPAGEALHNLTTLLQDTGGSFTTGSLNYSINTGDNTLLMEKSDGSYWLSIWNENAGAHAVTLSLGSAATTIAVYDPETGTTAIETASNTNSITLTVPDHPVIVEITNGSSTAPTPTPTATATPTPTPTATATPTPTPTATSAANPDPVVTVPGTQAATIGQALAISGVTVSDAWAANHAGSMALNVETSSGTVSMTNASGNAVAGSGTSAIHVTGSLAQLSADLATLSYTASTSSASISVDVWDQAGVETLKSFGVSTSATTGGTTPTTGGAGGSTATSTGGNTGAGTPGPTGGITIAASDASPVEIVSNTQITASSGDHMIFLNGTGDTLTATGGTETVMAWQGGNTITTGSGNDTIRYAGSNNVINAGSGSNIIADSGTNNTIVLPGANQGYDDIYGNLLTNGDKFDLTHALSGTNWNGDLSTIGNYVKLAASGTSTIISIDPTGTAGSSTTMVAKLEDLSVPSISTLLARAIT